MSENDAWHQRGAVSRLWLRTVGTLALAMALPGLVIGVTGSAMLIASIYGGLAAGGGAGLEGVILGAREARDFFWAWLGGVLGPWAFEWAMLGSAIVLFFGFSTLALLFLLGEWMSWVCPGDEKSSSLTLRSIARVIRDQAAGKDRRSILTGGNYFTDTLWVLLSALVGYGFVLDARPLSLAEVWAMSFPLLIFSAVALRARLRFVRERWLEKTSSCL